VEVSLGKLGLGTAPLGGLYRPVADEDADAVVDRAYELGLRFFDTAPLYGHGLAEERLGRALSDKPRSEVVVSTKVGRLLRPTPVFDFSYDGVLRSFEESLQRLGLDRVDILLVHDPDDHGEEALTGAYPALDRLRSEGAVRAIGVGMNQSELLARFAHEADFDCFLLAGRYTVLDQSGADELLPLCVERGIDVIAGGVYNSGILADPEHEQTYDYLPAPAEIVERALRLRAVCDRHGVPLKAAALQFPFRHPAVVSVLTGCRSVGELDENVRMIDVEIPAALWDELLDA
jgi:D-threo-aldose 1-dehydrogenase